MKAIYKDSDDFKPVPAAYPELLGLIRFAWIPTRMYNGRFIWMEKYVLKGFFPKGAPPFNIRYPYSIHQQVYPTRTEY